MADTDALCEDARWWLLPALALAAGVLLSLPFWLGDLDLRAAAALQAWNDGRGGAEDDRWWWLVPYYLPAVLTLAIGGGAVAAVVRGLLRPDQGMMRAGAYVLLVLGLGCGVVTNLILKDHWGRPRPRETVMYGGLWEYTQPWAKGIAGRGKSFPCGHATIPAMGVALWLLWRRRRPRLAWSCLAGGAVLALWVGAARMLAQAHWLSDVLWALVVMTVVAALVHRLLMHRPQQAQAPPACRRPRWPAYAIGGGLAAVLIAGVLCATPCFQEFALSADRAAIGAGPWRLQVVADRAAVAIELRPGAERTVQVNGRVRGFGLPGARLARHLVAGSGTVRIDLAAQGVFTERNADIVLAVDPADLAAIDVEVGTGDVVVRASEEAARIAITARTGQGEVRLPAVLR